MQCCVSSLCVQLVPCYRGYVVDSLRDLAILDDKEITVTERNQSEGVALHCHQCKGTYSRQLSSAGAHVYVVGWLPAECVTSALVEVKFCRITGLPELNPDACKVSFLSKAVD